MFDCGAPNWNDMKQLEITSKPSLSECHNTVTIPTSEGPLTVEFYAIAMRLRICARSDNDYGMLQALPDTLPCQTTELDEHIEITSGQW